jgi:hypothetical protein
MAEQVIPEEVMAFLEGLKKKNNQHYENEVFKNDMMPDKVITARNHQVMDSDAIDRVSALVHFHNGRNKAD